MLELAVKQEPQIFINRFSNRLIDWEILNFLFFSLLDETLTYRSFQHYKSKHEVNFQKFITVYPVWVMVRKNPKLSLLSNFHETSNWKCFYYSKTNYEVIWKNLTKFPGRVNVGKNLNFRSGLILIKLRAKGVCFIVSEIKIAFYIDFEII